MTELKITEALFTASDLADIAGVDRKLVNLWLERKLIRPTHIERLAVRNRPMFSVIAIFKARLMKIMSESFSASASSSKKAVAKADRAKLAADAFAQMADFAADEGWYWAVARSVDRDNPLALLAAMTRIKEDWLLYLEFDVSKFAGRFEPEVPYIIVPVGAIFASVYRDCKKLRETKAPNAREGTRRARS